MLLMGVMAFAGCHKSEVPLVSTSQPSEITATSCMTGGVITSYGSDEVVERGVCWGTSPQPEITDLHVTAGSGIGSFSCQITNLTAGTTYYVRAYALSNSGVGYGEVLSFTTLGLIPEGAIGGRFSVSPTQQVYFSQGNLLYVYPSNTWQFPEKQWEYLVSGNIIGHFGWGTSGWGLPNTYFHPWDFDFTLPGLYGPQEHDLAGELVNCDWGSNPIVNGGGQPRQWRTLTYSEWEYLFSRNTSSGIIYTRACVSDVNGLILLPDDWDVSYYPLNPINGDGFDINIIDRSQWSVLERYGAVFLPAAGFRSGDVPGSYEEIGGYWSSSHYDKFDAINVYFDQSQFLIAPANRSYGLSVRLVQDVK